MRFIPRASSLLRQRLTQKDKVVFLRLWAGGGLGFRVQKGNQMAKRMDNDAELGKI